MTLTLLMLYSNYFVAAFPSALAYYAMNLTASDVDRIIAFIDESYIACIFIDQHSIFTVHPLVLVLSNP